MYQFDTSKKNEIVYYDYPCHYCKKFMVKNTPQAGKGYYCAPCKFAVTDVFVNREREDQKKEEQKKNG